MTIGERIAALDARERELNFAHFDANDGWRLGCQLRDRASALQAPVAIEVIRGQTRLFFASLNGATMDNSQWTRRKIAVALRFERSSYVVALNFAQLDLTLDAVGLSASDYALSGGALPISVAGTGVVGAVAVSGLAEEEDHEMVLAALSDLMVEQSLTPDRRP